VRLENPTILAPVERIGNRFAVISSFFVLRQIKINISMVCAILLTAIESAFPASADPVGLAAGRRHEDI
jgi:hypothetical protein